MMGEEKYQKKILELFEKSPVVSFKSIENIVKYKKSIKQYSKQLIRNLIIKGQVKRLGKGYYSKYDDSSLFVLCLKNSYLGLHSSLSFYDLWEQETIPVIITSERIRQGIRVINGQNVLIKRIDKKYVFGIDFQKDGGFYLPYSDLEKTFIDFFYFKLRLDENVLKEFRKRINKKKLESYLKKYPKRFREYIMKSI